MINRLNRLNREALASWGIALCVLGFLVQGAFFIAANGQTSDEAMHLAAGISYLSRHDFRMDPEHPPLMRLAAALPVALVYRPVFQPDPALWAEAPKWKWRLGRDFLWGQAVPGQCLLALARVPNLVLGGALVALVGIWARRLWGPGPGALGSALAAFEPNLLAHASLVTTDLGLAFFASLTLFLAWEYGRRASLGKAAGVGVALGLALATKLSALLLPSILAVLVIAGFAIRQRQLTRHDITRLGLACGLAGGIAVLVLWLSYFGQGFETYRTGLETLATHRALGHRAFFLGEISTKGWWLYFPVALLIKTPVATTVLLALSVAACRAGTPIGRREALFLALPPLLFLTAAAHSRLNIGIRHVLPVYPFAFVLASRVVTMRAGPRDSSAARLAPDAVAVLAGLAVLANVVSVLRVTPHHLAYFNEPVGGPERGHLFLGDSNLDWGQDLPGLRSYMDRTGAPALTLSYSGTAPPAAYGIRYQFAPTAGALSPPPADVLPLDLPRELLAVSVLNLQGVRVGAIYQWLAGREPLARIGYSIHVYDITQDAEAHVRLAEIYGRFGLDRHRERELAKAARLGRSGTHRAP